MGLLNLFHFDNPKHKVEDKKGLGAKIVFSKTFCIEKVRITHDIIASRKKSKSFTPL